MFSPIKIRAQNQEIKDSKMPDTLPIWVSIDLYSHDGDADIQRDLETGTATDKLAQYEGRLASLGGAELP